MCSCLCVMYVCVYVCTYLSKLLLLNSLHCTSLSLAFFPSSVHAVLPTWTFLPSFSYSTPGFGYMVSSYSSFKIHLYRSFFLTSSRQQVTPSPTRTCGPWLVIICVAAFLSLLIERQRWEGMMSYLVLHVQLSSLCQAGKDVRHGCQTIWAT